MGCGRFRLYVYNDFMGAFNMLSLLVIAVISFLVAFCVYTIESARIKEREQQERDWQHFLATGDDRPYSKGAKQ